ncbi:hypothetical protein DRN62_01935 [Nanoarchaeota archaeon]|nr:MAG: hypothetical protein DRN62_01935 [Nanoarchaeota archaeon]
MLIALAQAKVTTNLERNYEHFTELLERASRKGADLICFPELFPSSVPPFFDEPEELAERYDINLIAGFEEEGYNVCKVFSREGKCIGVQRKVYTARSERYKCGKSWKVFNIEGVKVGIVICSSLWRPEPASILREKGVDIIFNPSRLYAFLAKWWEHVP